MLLVALRTGLRSPEADVVRASGPVLACVQQWPGSEHELRAPLVRWDQQAIGEGTKQDQVAKQLVITAVRKECSKAKEREINIVLV